MAARGRKQKASLQTNLAGLTTEKRHNFDPSTPPASTENLHFTLNGETRRAPGPQNQAKTPPKRRTIGQSP
jgi:hypothetical protein